jgi:hypothetical protein
MSVHFGTHHNRTDAWLFPQISGDRSLAFVGHASMLYFGRSRRFAMAIEKQRLIHYLEKTVSLLKSTSHYEWGNSGACNCGHLAQVITGFKGEDIHRWSLEKNGEWSDKAELYCENSGYKIDNVISIMLKAGLQIEDINHIEYLDHPEILSELTDGRRQLERNLKQDVITYFECWIRLLQNQEAEDQTSSHWASRRVHEPGEIAVYDSIPQPDLEAI